MWRKRGYSELPVVTTGSRLGFRVSSKDTEEAELRAESPPLYLLNHSHLKASVTTPSCIKYACKLFFKMSAGQLFVLKCGCWDPEESRRFFQEIKSSVNKIKNLTAAYKITALPRKQLCYCISEVMNNSYQRYDVTFLRML